jgi:alkanesulfonate monooxygenase SsuD/methylene tetrahydromethanopterin reductase-like flavin-dependent oxidoreductase (luciferase family)
VLILAQRQAALVAKQAASLDILCGGRFRLGIGVGWNEIEFIGLNENFRTRGRRSEEQLRVMQALWAELCLRLQRGGGVRGWGRDDLGTGARGRGARARRALKSTTR